MKTMHQVIADNRTCFETAREFRKLIKQASGKDELLALDKRIERHYNAGTLDAKGLLQLDDLIMERLLDEK